jgi:hypothetical protein
VGVASYKQSYAANMIQKEIMKEDAGDIALEMELHL